MTGAAWQPDSTTTSRAQLTRFLAQTGCSSFAELHRRSVEDVAWFTAEVLRFLDIAFTQPYSQVLDLSRGPEWPQWCVGGRMNIAANCLRDHAHPAILWEGEEGLTRTVTYAQLRSDVEQCAAGLRSLGLQRGDAVGLHLPMLSETVVALLACAYAGFVAVPLFSGYGPGAIENRLNDVEAKALITCTAFSRRGKQVRAKDVADTAVAGCPTVRHVIVVPRADVTCSFVTGRDLAWEELLASGTRTPIADTAAEDPLIVLYTSGTTGQPKGILHTHCGFPVKSAQDMAFGTDVGRSTRICWITDLGWMMGPWLIYGALVLGGTLVLYDGAPDYPGPDRLWEFCARHRVEVLGISPTLVRSLLVYGDDPPRGHDLRALRIFGSTGEPWNPDPWWWLFETVGRRRVPIINYSGGTEISGGILMGNPLLPIKPCSFPAPCPGIAADVVDENCRPVRGIVGELVIRAPWIGMARGFWKAPDRYLETYWSRWPGVWVHGDWARIDEDDHWYILGRSDDTVKVAGKRVGPAEIESVLVSHDAVAEAAAIGIPHEQKGSCVVAFCVLAEGHKASPELQQELSGLVARELGKPLRPDKLLFVPSLPKTRNSKVMRRVIRAAYLGEDPGDLTALENPAAVDAIRATAQGAQ